MTNNKLRLFSMPIRRALSALVLILAFANSALAQDWRFEPILKIGGEYDDNATLDPRTDQEVDLSGLLLNARADIYYTSPATTFFVRPEVVSRSYNDDSDFDSDDFYLRSNLHSRAKLSTFGFRVDFDHQSVRTAERADADLDVEDPDEITDDDTGRVFRSGDRSKWRVSPYWVYQLSNVSSIGAEIDYRDTRYDDVFAGLLTDYSDARLDLTYRRSFSNTTTWGVSVTGRTYDSDSSPDDVNGYGLLAQIEHALSDETRVRAEIGFEDTDDESDIDTDPEVIGSVTLTRNLQTIRLLAQYRRSVSGGGAGRVTVRDSLNLNFRRRLSERISAGLGVRAYQSKTAGGLGLDEDRDYIQLRSGLVWYLTRSFVIEADYRYTVQNFDEVFGESANSNQVNLWFVYQPKTIPKI